MRSSAAAHAVLLGSMLLITQPARAQAPLPQPESPVPAVSPAEPAPTSPPSAPVTDAPAGDTTTAPPPAAAPPPPQSPVVPAPAPAGTVDPPAAASPGEPDLGVEAARKPSKLYFSLGAGGGYFHATSGQESDTRRFSGGSFALQLVLGGRAGKTRTVAVGGAYLRDQVFGLAAEDEVIDGDEPTLDDVAFGLWLLGFFLDVAVQSAPGLHFQGVAGFSGLSIDAPDRDTDSPFGLGLNLGVGYDFQVGQHLALGALLRSTFAPLSVNENNGTDVNSFAPSLLLTATTR